jgi:hypothetical protein
MKLQKLTAAMLGGTILMSLAFAITPPASTAGLSSRQPVRIAQATTTDRLCSSVNGQWYYLGNPGPIVTQSGDRLSVDMSPYGRPRATGRILSPTRIEITFPDDATYVGTLDGRGSIRWNNGSVWQALNFAGTWQYEGTPGPIITQSGDRLTVNMDSYRRPTATGTITAASSARVRFPDDITDTATLVSPNCIRWANGTTWTKAVSVRPETTTRNVIVQLTTGSDDLRGDGNNAFITLNLVDGTSTTEMILGGGFGQNSVVSKNITFPEAVSLNQIRSVTIRHDGSPRSGHPLDGYDNWDLQRLSVSLANSSFSPVANIYNSASDSRRSRFVQRFTGGTRQIVLPRQLP